MGGKLLASVFGLPEKRLDKNDFIKVEAFVLERLKSEYPNRRVESIGYFREKGNFGDYDCGVEVFSGENINWLEEFARIFGVAAHKNGNCVSFPIDGFQVDILLFSSEVWECALTYYNMEVGNFQGRIANAMGLSYGHRGLYLQVPLSQFGPELPDHEYREVLISRDPAQIFDILGYDYQQFLRGFANFEEMSQWVAASRYFSPALFSFDALNSINRTRNRKRPVYARFVEWCESQPKREEMPSKSTVLLWAVMSFPNVEVQMNEIRLEVLLNAERRAKFNGNLIKELRNLESGPALGKFIVDFKKKHVNFDAWLDSQSAEQVKSEILNHAS